MLDATDQAQHDGFYLAVIWNVNMDLIHTWKDNIAIIDRVERVPKGNLIVRDFLKVSLLVKITP
jgi:hypothetical protein